MQKIAIIQISEAGSEIAATLKRELKAKVIQRSEVARNGRSKMPLSSSERWESV